jgi:hypothetical protein
VVLLLCSGMHNVPSFFFFLAVGRMHCKMRIVVLLIGSPVRSSLDPGFGGGRVSRLAHARTSDAAAAWQFVSAASRRRQEEQ